MIHNLDYTGDTIKLPVHDLPPADKAVALRHIGAMTVQELLSRNSELSLLNRQLIEALAIVTKSTATALDRLTPRQREIMMLVLAGHPSKNIAADLNISRRTVENHRAAIMRRTGAASLPALVRLSMGVT